MKEVVINSCFGGFGLSLLAQKEYAAKKGFELFFYEQTKYAHSDGVQEYQKVHHSESSSLFRVAIKADLGEVVNEFPDDDDKHFCDRDIPRHDPVLIQVVKELGERASGSCAKLKVVEIPNDVAYEIGEYDGIEHVYENHRTWS